MQAGVGEELAASRKLQATRRKLQGLSFKLQDDYLQLEACLL
jgi:hypothetical protein